MFPLPAEMIAALVPAKALDQAKGRLAAVLSEDERRELALAMLEDVLRALQAVSRLDLIAVVSPDAEVLARAWSAQIRLNAKYRRLVGRGKRSTVAVVAVARELAKACFDLMMITEEVAA